MAPIDPKTITHYSHLVEVLGEQYDVTVIQLTKTTWMANANYDGCKVVVKGRSQNNALKNWGERIIAKMKT